MNNGTGFDDWTRVIEEMGKQARDRNQKERVDRAAWLRNYFQEDPRRIQELAGDSIILWLPEGPILSSKFAVPLLSNDRAMAVLWEEIAHRVSFESFLRDVLGLPPQDVGGPPSAPMVASRCVE